MNGRAWAASLVLHSGIVVLLVSFAGVDPSLRQPERWEVKMTFTAPPEPPTPPALPPPLPAFEPVVAPQPPVQSPVPPPVATKKSPAPTVSTPPRRLPSVAAIKPPPKRDTPPPSRQSLRPMPEKPASVPRKPTPSPPAVAAKAAHRPSKQPAAAFSDASSRPTRQDFPAGSWSAFKETREAPPGHRADASDAADRPTARDYPSPAKTTSGSGATNWQAALRAKLRELRVYPPVARRLGQEGVVTLLLEISASGDLRGLAVRQSSGHAVLDQAAQQLARNAVAALRGELSPHGESRLEIPVAYRLD